MGVTHLVRNATELNDVWEQVRSGDTVSLVAGDYGEAMIRRLDFNTEVTLRSADADNPAVFDTLSIVEVNGLSIENVSVALNVDEDTSVGVRGIYVTESQNVSIRDSQIVGGDAVVGVSTDTDPATIPNGVAYIGEPIGNAVYIRNSTDIEISGNEVTGFQRGITLLGSDRVVVSENDIHDLRGTPFRSTGSNGITVEGNEFTNSHPVNFGGQGDHGDFIHFTDAAQDAPITDIIVRDNFFHQGDGVAILGIVFATPTESMGYENVIIDNNVLYNGDRAGIVLENVNGGSVTNNTLVQSSGDDIKTAPGIRIDFASSDISILNNLASEVAIFGDRVDEDSLTIQGNIDVQSLNPQGDNYIGDILVNGLVDPENAQVSDFAVVPDLEGTGVGADIQSDSTVFFSALTTASDRTSLSANFHVDDANESGASYTFHFPDGTSIEGTDARYEFDQAGRHEVTLVAVINGQTQTITRTVEVFDPVRFDLGNLSAFQEDVSFLGDISVTDSRSVFGGDAAQIQVSDIAEALENLEEFSTSFSFAFNEESDGRETLARVNNYFTVMANGEDLTALIWLDDGSTLQLKADVPGLQDGISFDLALVFDQQEGIARLFVDGEVVAGQDGIEQSMGNGGNAPLYIGGMGSKSDFNGWIEDFTIQTDSSLIRPMPAKPVMPAEPVISAEPAIPAKPVIPAEPVTPAEPAISDKKSDADTFAPDVDTFVFTDFSDTCHFGGSGTDGDSMMDVCSFDELSATSQASVPDLFIRTSETDLGTPQDTFSHSLMDEFLF